MIKQEKKIIFFSSNIVLNYFVLVKAGDFPASGYIMQTAENCSVRTILAIFIFYKTVISI